MSIKWLKKGDRALIIAGNDKGQIGEVLGRKGDRVIIQGINVKKKHLRSRDQQKSGEIASIEMPMHISNVALCDADGSSLKLKVRITKEGKELFYIKNEKETIFRTIKKLAK